LFVLAAAVVSMYLYCYFQCWFKSSSCCRCGLEIRLLYQSK